MDGERFMVTTYMHERLPVYYNCSPSLFQLHERLPCALAGVNAQLELALRPSSEKCVFSGSRNQRFPPTCCMPTRHTPHTTHHAHVPIGFNLLLTAPISKTGKQPRSLKKENTTAFTDAPCANSLTNTPYPPNPVCE